MAGLELRICCVPDAGTVYSSRPLLSPTIPLPLGRPVLFLVGRKLCIQEDSRTYQALCRAGDAPGVLALLTNKAVEKKVLHRAFMKASTYGSDVNDLPILGEQAADQERHFKVDPHSIVAIYRDFVIPLTKDVEIYYLFQRAGYPCPPLEGIHD